MKWVSFIAAVVAVAAGFVEVRAQTVEFRVVERNGRTVVTGPGDAELNVAVQARVVGGTAATCLGQFSFMIHLVGESDFNGTLVRGLISNVDHTYSQEIATSAVVGRGGLASQFTYLAASSNALNGAINSTSVGFFNGPEQEIANVVGAAIGTPLLGTPGIDVDGDNLPDTWSGNGTGAIPANGATAFVDPTIAAAYFGAGGRGLMCTDFGTR